MVLFVCSLTHVCRAGEEKALMLPPVIQSKLVTRLREGTEYAVVLSAVYPNVQTASAPKLNVRMPLPVAELPVGDDSYLEKKIRKYAVLFHETLPGQGRTTTFTVGRMAWHGRTNTHETTSNCDLYQFSVDIKRKTWLEEQILGDYIPLLSYDYKIIYKGLATVLVGISHLSESLKPAVFVDTQHNLMLCPCEISSHEWLTTPCNT